MASSTNIPGQGSQSDTVSSTREGIRSNVEDLKGPSNQGYSEVKPHGPMYEAYPSYGPVPPGHPGPQNPYPLPPQAYPGAMPSGSYPYPPHGPPHVAPAHYSHPTNQQPYSGAPLSQYPNHAPPMHMQYGRAPPTAPYHPSSDSNRAEAVGLYSLSDGPLGAKPSYPYSTLIRCAILGSPKQRLTLSELYEQIEERFPYFKNAGVGWKNSIRHNLSLNKCFEKVARPITEPGKGSYWTVNEQAEPGTKRIRHRKHKKKKADSNDVPDEAEGESSFTRGAVSSGQSFDSGHPHSPPSESRSHSGSPPPGLAPAHVAVNPGVPPQPNLHGYTSAPFAPGSFAALAAQAHGRHNPVVGELRGSTSFANAALPPQSFQSSSEQAGGHPPAFYVHGAEQRNQSNSRPLSAEGSRVPQNPAASG